MTATERSTRWGILGTANIARAAFLPALREAGGTALVVGSRDKEVAAKFAAEHGVDEGVQGYARVLEDARVDAVYVALPNSLHAEWAAAALRAGKAVLCEKPLCTSVAETDSLLEVARTCDGPLWEAFVFPFHRQMALLAEILASGAIGEVREVQSTFHFLVRNPANIRLSAGLAGGALNDVGCYPVRLANLVFAAESQRAAAFARWGGANVDVESWGLLIYPGDRSLLLSCGLERAYDTYTRILGTEGMVELTNPFHPGRDDLLRVLAGGKEQRREHANPDTNSFTAAIRHIHAVIKGEAAPLHLAISEAMGTAHALAALHAQAFSHSGRPDCT